MGWNPKLSRRERKVLDARQALTQALRELDTLGKLTGPTVARVQRTIQRVR